MAGISSNVYSGPYGADGAQTAFPFSFSIATESEVAVEMDGLAVSKDLYRVTFDDDGGTVTFLIPPMQYARILLRSNPDYLQTSSFENEGSYNLATVNLINRRATIRDLVLKNKVDRALKIPIGGSLGDLPTLAGAEGKVLGYLGGAFIWADNDSIAISGAVDIAAAAAEGAASHAATATNAAVVAVGAAGFANAFPTLALALAATTDGQYSTVPQAGGYAADSYLRASGAMSFIATNPIGPGILTGDRIALEGTSNVTQAPVESLVSIDPLYGRFSDGRYIPASSNAAVTHNALATTGQAVTPGGGTFTLNYTTDVDGKAVHRFQMSAHGHILNISSPPGARRVKAKFYIKSNTGAGNQNVTAGLYSHNMANYPITEASWTMVSVDVVATAGDCLAVWNFSDQLPRDVLIKDSIQMYFDGEALPAVEANTVYALVPFAGFTLPGTMTFGNGNTLAPTIGLIDLRSSTGIAATFSAASYVVAFREDGASGFNAAIMFTPTATGIDYYAFQTGTEGGNLVGRILGTVYSGQPITGQGWLIMSARFDGAYSSVHLDGVSLAEGSGHAPVAIPWLRVGGGGGSPASPFSGLMGPMRFVASKLSDANMAQMVNHVRDRLVLHGAIMPVRNWYFFEGDSNTAVDRDSLPSWGKQVSTALGIDPRRRNLAGSSSTIDSVLSRLGFTVQRIREAKAFGATPIFSMMIGTNPESVGNLATPSKVQSVWAAARSAGAKVVAMTIPYRGDAAFSLSDWNTYNAWIRSQSTYYDAIIDVAADPIFQDPNNLTYFNPDKLHFTGAGNTHLAVIAGPVIAGLMT